MCHACKHAAARCISMAATWKRRRSWLDRNMAAFEGLNLQAIISTASGCGAHWQSSLRRPHDRPWQERQAAVRGNEAHAVNSIPNSQAGSLAARVMDISAFLAVAEGWDDVRLKSLPCKIAVHEPCSSAQCIARFHSCLHIAGTHSRCTGGAAGRKRSVLRRGRHLFSGPAGDGTGAAAMTK